MKGQYLKIDKVGYRVISDPMVAIVGGTDYEVVVVAMRLTNNITKIVNVASIEVYAELAHMGDYK